MSGFRQTVRIQTKCQDSNKISGYRQNVRSPTHSAGPAVLIIWLQAHWKLQKKVECFKENFIFRKQVLKRLENVEGIGARWVVNVKYPLFITLFQISLPDLNLWLKSITKNLDNWPGRTSVHSQKPISLISSVNNAYLNALRFVLFIEKPLSVCQWVAQCYWLLNQPTAGVSICRLVNFFLWAYSFLPSKKLCFFLGTWEKIGGNFV